MYISGLQQMVCEDQGRYNASPLKNSVDPESWISSSLPVEWALSSFHFFVDWSCDPPVAGRQIWLTRQLTYSEAEYSSDPDSSDILKVFKEDAARNEFEKIWEVCRVQGHRLALVLLPDVKGREITERSNVWVITKEESADYRVYNIDVSQLKQAVKRHSGGEVRVGGKGLKYATSKVECYLSKSEAAYPGDADAVLIDSNNKIKFIIEYKKHNLTAPISEHLAKKYYAKSDWRKYRRLYALSEFYYNQGLGKVPIIIFYYSTVSPIVRFQEILLADKNDLTIGKDSGDVFIDGWLPETVGDYFFNWLEV